MNAVNPPIEIDEVTSLAALERLHAEWAEVWRDCPDASPFQSPEWLIPWWRHFGTGELWTLAIRREGRLSGIVPLFVDMPDRKLMLLGSGISDIGGALFAPGFENTIAAVFAHLSAHQQRWQVCELQQLRDGSRLLSHPLPDGSTGQTIVQEARPVLLLPKTAGRLSDAVPEGQLRKLELYRRRGSRVAAVRTIRIIRGPR